MSVALILLCIYFYLIYLEFYLLSKFLIVKIKSSFIHCKHKKAQTRTYKVLRWLFLPFQVYSHIHRFISLFLSIYIINHKEILPHVGH